MSKCSQCRNNAFYTVEGHPLCIHCYAKLQEVHRSEQAMLAEQANFLMGQMESTVGLPQGTLGPRIKVPQPITIHNPVTTNNNHFSFDKSVIGVVNTGHVENIQLDMSRIETSGGQELAQTLQKFTQDLINDQEVTAALKTELLDQLSFLSNQLTLRPPDRKQSVVSMVLKSIEGSVSTIARLSSTWSQLSPMIEQGMKVLGLTSPTLS